MGSFPQLRISDDRVVSTCTEGHRGSALRGDVLPVEAAPFPII